MRILFEDIIQYSNAPATLKSPALADTTRFLYLDVVLDKVRTFDHIGIGNTNATYITVNGDVVHLSETDKNGLYKLSAPQTTQTIQFQFAQSTDVGRIALGMGRKMGAAPAREPGFSTNIKSRVTLSGQVIGGVGGACPRILNVDFRYKVDRDIYMDISRAYPTQIARMFPLFMRLDEHTEPDRFPMERFYGYTKPELIFQSSVNFFRYSKKFKFTEAF